MYCSLSITKDCSDEHNLNLKERGNPGKITKKISSDTFNWFETREILTFQTKMNYFLIHNS